MFPRYNTPLLAGNKAYRLYLIQEVYVYHGAQLRQSTIIALGRNHQAPRSPMLRYSHK
jgi:hypothetical protein